MKLALSIVMLITPILLASCMSGCSAQASLQQAANSLVYATQPTHDYAYRGPYQFSSGVAQPSNTKQ